MNTLKYKINIHGAKPEICALARAAMKAGLSEPMAILLARMAERHDSGTGEDTSRIAAGYIRQMRAEHAAKHPNGKWAILQRRYGLRAMDGRAFSRGHEMVHADA